MKIKQKPGDIAFDVVTYIIVIFLILITLYPLVYVAFASISDPIKVSQSGGILLWPTGAVSYTHLAPKLRHPQGWVGERCVRGEALAKADVDCTQVRMPE